MIRKLFISTSAVMLAASTAFAGIGVPDVKISEIRGDQPSTDNDEYFELVGPPGQNLDALTYVVIGDSPAGGSGVVDGVVSLVGSAIPASGYFVAAEDTFTLGTADLTANLNFENSDNLTHVLVSGWVGSIGLDLDPDDDGVLDLIPWTVVIDAVGLVEEPNPPTGTEYVYGAALGFVDVGPIGPFVPAHAYLCDPDDGGEVETWLIGEYDPVIGWDTPGAVNEVCDDNDGDRIPNVLDNCDDDPNPDQADCDGDGIGDLCEPDGDGDGVPDDCDNCPGDSNPDQADCDNDGAGDVCEILEGSQTDANQNGIPDECEEIIINEILYDPAQGPTGDSNADGTSDASQDEFVEIFNNTGAPLDVSGWEIADGFGPRHVFPAGTVIPDQCVVVVFGGGFPNGLYGGALVQVASSGALGLNNTPGDSVTLTDLALDVRAFHAYLGTDASDESITRDPDASGPYVAHSVAVGSGGALFSPGELVTGASFAGCPPPADADGDLILDSLDNCPNNFNPLQEDCDGDGVGDACSGEPDCNFNTIPDNCDIAAGTSNDCNGNGIPDECDLAVGTLTDTNGNNVPDQCEFAAPVGLRLNEIRVEQDGADDDEYFEIKGPPGTSLNGVRYIVIGDDNAGATGSGYIETVVNLNGETIPADGHYLLVEDTFTLAALIQIDESLPAGDLRFEGNDNVTHLLVANYYGTVGQDLDTNDNGMLNVQPWLDLIDGVGIIEEANPPTGTEYSYGASLGFVDVGPTVDDFLPGHVYRCEPDGTWLMGTFDVLDPNATDTPGVLNSGCSLCVEDLSGNSQVDFADILVIIGAWGPCGVPCPEDLSGNGQVDFADILVVIGAWGPCP